VQVSAIIEEKRLQTENVQKIAKQNLEKGERWHKKLGVKEIVFGFQDNSIAILAVLAGVIGGSLQRGQILLAGLAAVIAGAISVAIGDYVSSKSEVEYFEAEINRESLEIQDNSPVEREEVRQIYMKKAPFTESELSVIDNRITSDKKAWLDTMAKEELGIVRERFVHPFKVALIMMVAETVGGLVPLAPLLVTQNIRIVAQKNASARIKTTVTTISSVVGSLMTVYPRKVLEVYDLHMIQIPQRIVRQLIFYLPD